MLFRKKSRFWIMALCLAFCALVPTVALASQSQAESTPASEQPSENSVAVDESTQSDEEGSSSEGSAASDESASDEAVADSDAPAADDSDSASESVDSVEAASTDATDADATSDLASDDAASTADDANADSATAAEEALLSIEEAILEAESLEPGDPVFVNGSSGDDSNPGTEEAPVKTFAKAKELLESLDSDTIYVTGAIQVTSSETWSLGEGKRLMRDALYNGELVHVSNGATLTLQDIVIDGASSDGATGIAHDGIGDGGSLIGVYNSTLTIGEGAYLQNNNIRSSGTWYPEGGGAVYANKSTVNLEGGTVRNNSAVYGGGIYGMYDSVINITSGTISGNRAVAGADKELPYGYGGYGGGVCVWEGADINFSGGTITGNTAAASGGGIAVGVYYASTIDSQILTMTGGTVTGNTASSDGGGIFIQAGLSASGNRGTQTYSIAYITAGYITGNTAVNGMFGGGGIYVNGYSSYYSDYHNGELRLGYAEIANNTAKLYGGGYAACTVSITSASGTAGAIYYNNTTESGSANEMYILASTALGNHSGNPKYSISPTALGGGSYVWKYDSGSEVPLDKLTGILRALYNEELCINNDLTADSPEVQSALKLATVHITGNTSYTRGGGIGTNGSVYIGEVEDVTSISVSKTWNDVDNKDSIRPDSIKVNLYRDGQYIGYQSMTPDGDGNWSMTFANLPIKDSNGHEYAYTVEEREVDGYTASVSGDAKSGYAITNTRTVSVPVTKVWVGDEGDSVTVRLLANGDDTAKSLTITKDDAWSKSFDGLAKYDDEGELIVYTVTEDAVDGYCSEITGDADIGFTVTNTQQQREDAPPVADTPSDTPGGSDAAGGSSTSAKSGTLPGTGDAATALAILMALAFAGLAGMGAVRLERRRRAAHVKR